MYIRITALYYSIKIYKFTKNNNCDKCCNIGVKIEGVPNLNFDTPSYRDDDWSGSDHGGDSGGGGYGLEVAETVDKERPASFGCLEVLHDVIADLVGIERDDFAGDAVCFPDLCGKCGIGIDAYAHKARIRISA